MAARNIMGPYSGSDISLETLSQAIDDAYVRLQHKVVLTPTIRLPWLDTAHRRVWAKLEFQQCSGSFKYRGALNALSLCPSTDIITASAGNHALATAAAGAELGKRVIVIAPATASEVKMSRLASNASVTVIGKDLYEAVNAAKQRAAANDLHFLSPYADFDVVSGAGTVALEAVEQLKNEQPDIIVVPLGGGGLAAGVGACLRTHLPHTRVICTHPSIFGRSFTGDAPISQQLLRTIEASLSDGLAVQLTEPTPFASIIDETISGVVQVNETETLSAVAALLRLQSLLIEGSAATTVASLLADPAGNTFRGNVLLLLTGGNIASTTMARALVADVPDATIRQRLGLRHILDPVEKHGTLAAYHRTKVAPEQDSLSGHQIFIRLTAGLESTVQDLQKKAARKASLDKRLELDEDIWCTDIFGDLNATLLKHLVEFKKELSFDAAQFSLWEVEDRYRILLNMHSMLASVFERASAAYDQSRRSWYFDTSAQSAAAVNYDRYGTGGLRTLEIAMLDTIRLGNNEAIDLLLTSSGMAAFQVLFLYLMQVLRPEDVIVLSPYIYFEALEQLQAIPHMRLVHAPDFSSTSIIGTAERYNAKIVFFDAVANMVDLPTTDVRQLLQNASERPGWSERTIVIDGSMTSGALNVFDWLPGPHKPTLLYYESVSKYLSMGLDLQMGGLIAYPTCLDEQLRTIRRNSGSIMYTRASTLVPSLTYEIFQSRMRILNEQAELFAHQVASAVDTVALVRHPREWRKYGWRHGGTLCTIRFLHHGMNNKEGLEACIELVLRAAQRLKVPFVKGVSFGFSTPRISAASSMAKDSDPFLRINVGLEGSSHLGSVADAVIEGVLTYVAISRQSLAD